MPFIVPRLNIKQLGIPKYFGEIPKQELNFATFLNTEAQRTQRLKIYLIKILCDLCVSVVLLNFRGRHLDFTLFG